MKKSSIAGYSTFLDHRVYTVDLVNKQDIAPFQGGEEGCNISGFFEYRAGGSPDLRTHFMSDDMGKGCLSKTRRPGEQDVIQGFTPLLCCPDGDLQGFFDLYLPDKFFQSRRTDGRIVSFFSERFR